MTPQNDKLNIRIIISNLLLDLLNFINRGTTPIAKNYGRIDNIEFFQKEFLVQSGDAEPDITLRKFMWEIEQMSKCGTDSGLTVFENGVGHPATEKDIYDVTHL